MEFPEQFLLEQLRAWLSTATQSVVTGETDARLGFATCQMYWLSAPTTEHKIHGLLGMAYYQRRLNKSDETTKAVKMALQMLVASDKPKTNHLAYACCMLASEPGLNTKLYDQTVELLGTVAKQNHRKWNGKKSRLPSNDVEQSEEIANQFIFFEQTEQKWIADWLAHENEISASYLYTLKAVVQAGRAYSIASRGRYVDHVFVDRDSTVYTIHRNTLANLKRDGSSKILLSDFYFKLNEKLGETWISPKGTWLGYQKVQGRFASSMCFINIENPFEFLQTIDGKYVCKFYWTAEDKLYFVDYKKFDGSFHQPRLLVSNPLIKEKPGELYSCDELDTYIDSHLSYESKNLIFLTQTKTFPHRQGKFLCLSMTTKENAKTLYEAEWISFQTFDEDGAWLLSHDQKDRVDKLVHVSWPWKEPSINPCPHAEKRVPHSTVCGITEFTAPGNSESFILQVTTCDDKLVAHYRFPFRSEIHILSKKGELIAKAKLPFEGTVGSMSKGLSRNELVFSLSSFACTQEILVLNVSTNEVQPFILKDDQKLQYPTEMEIRHATADDGAEIPVLIISKERFELNGSMPLICYGYGGHNRPAYDGYNPFVRAWLEMGGAFAVAAVRGGGDLGPGWYESGIKTSKHKSRDDFISVCKFLVEQKYTSTERLGIFGASAGGMLMGSVLVKAPELFGAVVSVNGIHDMEKLTGYNYDYGSPGDDSNKTRLEYSPLHNLKPSNFPATLIVVSNQDQIVPSWNSYKFYCALKQCQLANNPILLRNFDFDHDLRGAYSYPAEVLGFFAHHLGLTVAP